MLEITQDLIGPGEDYAFIFRADPQNSPLRLHSRLSH
jgi:hypothetical protein